MDGVSDTQTTGQPSLPPPPTGPTDEGRRTTPAWAWLTLIALAAAVAAAVVITVMWSGARDDLDHAETALETTNAELGTSRSELAEAGETLEQTSADLEETEVRAEAAELEAESANALAAQASAHADEIEARFDGLEDMLQVALESESNRPADTEAATCILDQVGVEGIMASILLAGDPTIARDIDPELLGDVGAAGIRCGGPLIEAGPGDDPALDQLYDGCAAGDGEACDELYFGSPLGSEYERFAATCGDRFTFANAQFECAGAI
jgi:hypothetical protein